MYMSSFSVNQNHPLIPKNENYRLNRKLLSIHSEDRDISKWSDANHFEVDLPVELKDVTSLRLLDIQLPSNYYVFSNNYQNTKFTFQIKPTESYSPSVGVRNIHQCTALSAKFDGNDKNYTVIINEGFYTHAQMALEIENAMNNSVEEYLNTQSSNNMKKTYQHFNCLYNEIDLKLYIGNDIDEFYLTFDNSNISYSPINCSNNIPSNNSHFVINSNNDSKAWEHYTYWGLGSYLGFNREEYNFTSNNHYTNNKGTDFYGLNLCASAGTAWLTPDPSGGITANPNGLSYFYKAINTLNLFGDGQIYMELDKYNSMDEIEPFSNNSNTFNKNCMSYHGKNVKLNNKNNTNCLNINKPLTRTSNGVYNAAFAKIPVFSTPSQVLYVNGSDYLSNVFFSDPPIARIKKLKVKFRYHDGRLVDFRGCNLSFTIEANELKNEINKNIDVRVPSHYIL